MYIEPHLHFLFAVVLYSRGESEVGDLDVHALAEQHVAQLEVAVDDVLTVDVATSLDKLS